MLRGEFVVPADVAELTDAIVYVRLEDTTDADRSVTDWWEQRVHIPRLTAGQSVEFSIDDSRLRTDRRYSVRIHVDVGGDGEIGPGDLISFQSHSIRAVNAERLRIPLKQVAHA